MKSESSLPASFSCPASEIFFDAAHKHRCESLNVGQKNLNLFLSHSKLCFGLRVGPVAPGD